MVSWWRQSVGSRIEAIQNHRFGPVLPFSIDSTTTPTPTTPHKVGTRPNEQTNQPTSHQTYVGPESVFMSIGQFSSLSDVREGHVDKAGPAMAGPGVPQG
jgi:hypothetical protein